MSNRFRLAFLLAAAGCGGETVVEPTVLVVTAIIVSIDKSELGLVNETAQATAQSHDQFGLPISATVIWTALNPSFASISSSGLITAHAKGIADFTAHVGGANGTVSATLTLNIDPLQIELFEQVTSAAFNSTTQRWECHYTLTLVAGGLAGNSATLESGSVVFRRSDGTSFRIPLSEDDMVDFWGQGLIAAGESLEAFRIAWSPNGEFDLEHTFALQMPSPDNRLISLTSFSNCF